MVAGKAEGEGGADSILYTVGYEGASQAALLEALLFHDVNTLVDIRELPQSRRPGFSKKALGAAVEEHGIRYIHMRALGTPRDVRHRHRADHDLVAFREGYLAHLAEQDEAMEELVARALQETCCLLCYEADPRHCHRWFVAERAEEIAPNIAQKIERENIAVASGFKIVHLSLTAPTSAGTAGASPTPPQ